MEILFIVWPLTSRSRIHRQEENNTCLLAAWHEIARRRAAPQPSFYCLHCSAPERTDDRYEHAGLNVLTHLFFHIFFFNQLFEHINTSVYQFVFHFVRWPKKTARRPELTEDSRFLVKEAVHRRRFEDLMSGTLLTSEWCVENAVRMVDRGWDTISQRDICQCAAAVIGRKERERESFRISSNVASVSNSNSKKWLKSLSATSSRFRPDATMGIRPSTEFSFIVTTTFRDSYQISNRISAPTACSEILTVKYFNHGSKHVKRTIHKSWNNSASYCGFAISSRICNSSHQLPRFNSTFGLSRRLMRITTWHENNSDHSGAGVIFFEDSISISVQHVKVCSNKPIFII